MCDSHFQFDNKYLHKSIDKQTKKFNEGIIQWRQCVSCKKYVTFFSRDAGCAIHSWHLNKKIFKYLVLDNIHVRRYNHVQNYVIKLLIILKGLNVFVAYVMRI